LNAGDAAVEPDLAFLEIAQGVCPFELDEGHALVGAAAGSGDFDLVEIPEVFLDENGMGAMASAVRRVKPRFRASSDAFEEQEAGVARIGRRAWRGSCSKVARGLGEQTAMTPPWLVPWAMASSCSRATGLGGDAGHIGGVEEVLELVQVRPVCDEDHLDAALARFNGGQDGLFAFEVLHGRSSCRGDNANHGAR